VFNGFRNRFEICDVAVCNRILGQGLDRIALDTVQALTGVAEFDHLDGRSADVNADEGRRLRLQEIEIQIEVELQRISFSILPG
jgi:hypothetical protein